MVVYRDHEGCSCGIESCVSTSQCLCNEHAQENTSTSKRYVFILLPLQRFFFGSRKCIFIQCNIRGSYNQAIIRRDRKYPAPAAYGNGRVASGGQCIMWFFAASPESWKPAFISRTWCRMIQARRRPLKRANVRSLPLAESVSVRLQLNHRRLYLYMVFW